MLPKQARYQLRYTPILRLRGGGMPVPAGVWSLYPIPPSLSTVGAFVQKAAECTKSADILLPFAAKRDIMDYHRVIGLSAGTADLPLTAVLTKGGMTG